MLSLCKRMIKLAWCNANSLQNNLSKSSFLCHHPRIHSSYVTSIRTMGKTVFFNSKNTTLELKKKLKQLHIILENECNISLRSMDYILSHPCFEAARISKADIIILLHSCSRMYEELPEKRTELVWKIWEKIKNNYVVDLDVYHHLLIALRDNDVYVDAIHMLTSLEKNGFLPNVETYTLLLECVSENQDFDAIERILSAMKKDRCEVSERGLNAILYSVVKCRGLDSAKEYLTKFENINFSNYTSLLRGVAERQDSSNFNRLLEEARDNNVEFPLQNRVSIVQSLVKGNLISFIPKVLGAIDDWESHHMILLNVTAKCLCLRNDAAVFEMIKYTNNNLIYQVTPGIFLAQAMVRAKVPIDDILSFCSEKHSAPRLKAAAYFSLREGSFEYSLALFKAMKAIDLPLRPHFFWPMFLSCESDESIFNILKIMKKLNVEPDYDTLLKYVVKRLSSVKPDLEEKFEKLGIGPELFVTPLLENALRRKQFLYGINLCHKYKSKIDYERLYFTIASGFSNCEDFDLISQICSNDSKHLVKVFHNLLFHFKNEAEPRLVEKFLNSFKKNGTSLYEADLNVLLAYLKLHNLDPKIWLHGLLNEVNTELSSARPHLRDMNIEQLENHIVYLRKNNYLLRQALRRLLIMHSSVGNTDRVMELKQELEERGMEFSVGMKIALMKAFCQENDFQQAYDIFVEMKAIGLHEKIEGTKFLMLADTAAKNGRIEAMYEILKSKTNSQENNLTLNCCKLLNTVVEHYGVDAANKLFELLMKYNYCRVKVKLLAPIITYYLNRNQVENAANACLQYADRYRCMPMKKALMYKLAALTVAEKYYKSKPKFQPLLHKILQTSGYLYGSSQTNLMYILCLAELGLLVTLKLYLKESYTGIEEKTLWRECNKLSDQNDEKVLLNLEKVFKETQFNIEPIYINLLKIYSRKRDLKSATELLKSLEESKRLPSMEFLKMFSELQTDDNNV